MKNILLTGSNGFIGSYFKNNYNNKYNINTFSFRSNDLKELKLSSIDTVVYLSALVHQMTGASEDEYKKINITQTLELAKKAKETGIKHFVFMSTVKVYGEETNNIYTESTPCLPQDNYGESKLEAEQRLQKLEDANFKVSIIRTPIVYGYGVKANIQNLIKLVSKIPILPFGDIQNKRSMVYIGNLCYLMDQIILQEKSGIFLASDDKSLSTTKFVELIAKYLNKKVYLVNIPFFNTLLKLVKPSFQKRLYGNLEVDNSKTKDLLGLKNPYSTEDGIRFMIKGSDK